MLIKECTKKTTNFFFIFWARRGLILAPTYLYVNGESGLRSSFMKKYLDKYLKNGLIFLIILKTFSFKFLVLY